MVTVPKKAERERHPMREAILREMQEPVRIPEEEKKKIMEELRKVASHERVRDDPHILASYPGPAFNITGKHLKYRLPDIVVYPKSTEEVKGILMTASKHKIPVTVSCMQSTQVASSPLKGGILLDLMNMDRIHKIDTEHSYVVVEPGVRISQLKKRIGPDYTVPKGSYYSSFSVVSTLAAAMACHNFTNRMWDQVIGFEMVMPDGTVLYTGTMVYRDCNLWTDVQHTFSQIKNLFMPNHATTGVITKAAIRIWPILDKLAIPIFGFDDFEPALKWTHAISKSSMADQAMVWFWPVAGLLEYKHTGAYLDYTEDRMNCYQDEKPKEMGLFNCYAWVQMRGYKEEIEGALKTAKRLAREYGGKYLPESELQKKWPKMWKYWTSMMEEGGEPMNPEQTDFTSNFTGTVDEIIKLYRGLVEKWKEFGYKNWNAYLRMFNAGQAPWFRYFPLVEAETEEEVQESLRLRDEITRYILDNYNVEAYGQGNFFNDPKNPERFIGRGEPIHRLLSAVQREFDPEGIMTPVMKKYGLF